MIVYIYFILLAVPKTHQLEKGSKIAKKQSYLHISELFKTKKAWEQSNIL